MSTNQDEEEDEKVVDVGAATRRAWYAGHADGLAGGGFESPAFRGVKGPGHGGSQHVKPEDTAGSIAHCWCGQFINHDWPGKAVGAPHPKETAMSSPAPGTAPEPPRIERKQLRGYHADVVDVILTAVNGFGVEYRIAGSKILLYPPDGTSPLSVRAGNSETGLKRVLTWFGKHCLPTGMSVQEAIKRGKTTAIKKVDTEVIKELAETMNSEEHLPKLAEPSKPADPPEQPRPAMAKTAPKPEPEPVEEDERETPKLDALMATDEWVTYVKSKSKEVHPDFLINEATGKVKCKQCGMILAGRSSTAGHLRTHHSDTSTLWGPEAKARAVNTYFTHKAQAQVEEAITILQTAMGIEAATVDTSEVESLKEQLNKVRREDTKKDEQITALRSENGKQATKIVELGTQVAELKAKLTLLREAFSNLEE